MEKVAHASLMVLRHAAIITSDLNFDDAVLDYVQSEEFMHRIYEGISFDEEPDLSDLEYEAILKDELLELKMIENLRNGSACISFSASVDGGWGEVSVDGEWSISSTNIVDAATAADCLINHVPEAEHVIREKLASIEGVPSKPKEGHPKHKKKSKQQRRVSFGSSIT